MPEIAKNFEVYDYPTYISFIDSEITMRFSSKDNIADLQKMIDNLNNELFYINFKVYNPKQIILIDSDIKRNQEIFWYI